MPRKAARREIFQGDGPTPEQLAKGDIERRFVTHAETATKSMAHISSHSPVERWSKAGRLSVSQMRAIALVRGLWEQLEEVPHQRLCAKYDERIPGSGDNEYRSVIQIQAKRDIARIESKVQPEWAWDAFETVCRDRLSAWEAGEALGFSGTKGAQAATLMLVRMVADQIAKEERL